MSTSLQPGTRLGHYEIRAKIGEGGMGEVYLAQDMTLNRKVAIKFLPVESQTSEQANKRLLREAQAAATLDHPNICTVHEVATENGHSFIVMQYVEGKTLEARINGKTLEFSAAISFAIQVADALAEAHVRGIIHRDVKPSNIIITSRGPAKVMDFGLAKVTVESVQSEAETKSLLTTPGAIIGTIPYMSPEQVHGQALDARTDIFSFGVLLYEMLTGQKPFTAQSAAGLISAILTKEPAPLSDYVATCPQELQRIVSRCLEKDRERRYQKIRDVATDLESIRHESAGAIIRPSSIPERLDAGSRATVTDYVAPRITFFSRRRLLVFGTIVLVAAVISIYAAAFRTRRNSPVVSSAIRSPAYDYYLRGKVNAGSENRENNENAIKLLEQATATDPNFAPAYAELARAYNVKAFYLASAAEKKKLNEDAEVAVAQALALDPNLAEGHYARGLILWTHAKRFPHEQVIQSYKRALALNPNLDEAHHQLGLVYLHIGLLDKGWAEIEKAVEINPGNTLARFRFGVINLYRGQYEEALAIFNSTALDKNPSLLAFQTATALFQLGRRDEASALIDKYLRDYPNDEGGVGTSVKAMILAKAGQTRAAEEAIQRASEIGQDFGHFHHAAYNIGCAYAIMGNFDQAIKWLQNAADDGFPCYPLFATDANLDSLRKDERFNAFMAKSKQQWERYNASL